MRWIAPLAAVVVLATPAIASYHYIHYNGRSGPFNPIYEKFNLAALPNNTLTFFVSDQGPTTYGPNDSFVSVLSQIKQAAAAWNAVPTSDLRVAFGGLENYSLNPTVTSPGAPTLNSTTPGADVIFVDLPGLLGLGAPTISTEAVSTPSGGRFFPIVRGLVMLSRDTTRPPGPSYTETFFATAVHEMGHALGLQHTWTGSAMSQGVVRNTSRARPLDADDIAALSILYGKPDWQSSFGSISGRVTFSGGQPVALASVVAVSATGPAVSTLTDPNGNYRIEGLPTIHSYSVYVHPLPPGTTESENLRVPVDQANRPFAASAPFQTVFHPGTLDPAAASTINVAAGRVVQSVNFSVPPRSAVPTYDVVTYAFLDTGSRALSATGDRRITPAFINTTQAFGIVVAQAAHPAFLPTPQALTILGGFPTALLSAQWPSAYIDPYQFGTIAAYFPVTGGLGTGPRHLVFNFGNDLYVLPNGVTLVQKAPPQVQSALPNADGSATITGAGFGPDSVVYFDGMPAAIQTPVSGTEALSTVTVKPPQGLTGQIATVTVYNADGQNSMLIQSDAPPTYLYPAAPAPLISNVSLTALPAASSAAIEITANGTNFVDGQVTVGFGSNDVTVRRVWVQSPARLLANVTVTPGAAIGTSQISVISGLTLIPQAGTFQVQTARAGFPFINLPVVNADSEQRGIYGGSTAVVTGQNLAVSSGTVSATLNDVQVPVASASATQVRFIVPAGWPSGPATLRLNNGTVSAFPVIVQIDNPPPQIIGINSAAAVQATGFGVSAGDLLNLIVVGLDPAAATADRVRIRVSGLEMQVVQINPLLNGVYQIQFLVTQSFGGAQVPVTVAVDGSVSPAYLITVR